VSRSKEIIKKNTLSIATLIVVAVLFLSCKNNNIEQIAAFTHPPGAPEVIGDSIEILYSDSAVIRFKLYCPEVKIFQDEEPSFNEFPKGFRIEQYDSKKRVTSSIKASYGKYYEYKDLWEAKQNVIAVTEAGDSLLTELLYWDQKKEMIYSDQFVKIITKDKTFTGTGFESDLQMTSWRIIKPKGTIFIEVEE